MLQGRSLHEPAVATLARAAIARGLEALAAPSSAGSGPSGLRWLERAHRLLPHDPSAVLTLASACLADDPARAAKLFQDIADTHDIRQAWLGLAAARLRLAGPASAAEPLAVVLSRHAFNPDVMPLAQTIGRSPGCRGWCALRSDGGLEIHAATPNRSPARSRINVSLDGTPVQGTTLPRHWQRGRIIDVRIGDDPLLGSPIQVDAIRRLTGCVEVHDGGIRGWAWHPNDPETAPVLTLLDASRRRLRRFVATDETTVAGTAPLARPRSFSLTRMDLPDKPGPVHIVGPNGNDLPGSPLDPLADQSAHVAAALQLGQAYAAGRTARSPPAAAAAPALRADAPVPAHPVGADGRKRAVTIVLPVRDDAAGVLACLDTLLATLPAAARVVVVDDASSDPAIIAALDALRQRRRIALLRHPAALGFAAAANAGIRAVNGRDVVVLSSDILLPPNWLQRLREAAYLSRDIGTVTPLSNDAAMLSYPGPADTNQRPDQATTTRLDQAAQRANGATVIDVPTGIRFCLYLRRDCLNAVGGLRADLFAQGQGEETDFCLRARRLGWRNVALTGLFVGQRGGTAFTGDAAPLRARNSRILEQLHPGYQDLNRAFLALDPLADARRRIDLYRWRQDHRACRRSAILITHDDGGGVEQRLLHAINLHLTAGRRAIVLRPAVTASGAPAVAVRDGTTGDCRNLVYAMPRELPALLRLLRAAQPEIIEAHHLAGYPAAIYDLVTKLRVPYDAHIHDYAWFCPRVSLVGAHDRYCGEPELPGCETCIADNGHFLQQDIPVDALRRRSAAFLSAARRVVVPSEDTGIRMRRHFAGLATTLVAHEDDAALAVSTVAPRLTRGAPRHSRPGVCVVGGIGVHKGYDILLACARDAARRDLDLEFIVVGHTIDDARMLATGRVFVTGRFDPNEALELISQQNTRLGFVPSICPETWCLSLGEIWRAGLRAAAFDIGAPAERIRRTGRGILLPLGLSPSAINNKLSAAIRATPN